MYQIRRPPEGADSIFRNVKEENLKIKVKVRAMEDVDYIYNLSLTNIILCCLAIVLIPFSIICVFYHYLSLYVCLKIIFFSIAIICFVEASLYWNLDSTKNENLENSGDKESNFIKKLINKECFHDPVDPINNLKLKNVF